MSKNRITSEIDKKFVGKDSKGCYLLTYKYKNGFLQIHPIPKEGINKIILEFLKEHVDKIPLKHIWTLRNILEG